MRPELTERLMQCFRYIGPPNPKVGPKFLHHIRVDFLHSSIAPCFLRPGAKPTVDDLRALERGVFHGYEGATQDLHAFFSVIGEDDAHRNAVVDLAVKAGWIVDKHTDSIEYFDQIIEPKAAAPGFVYSRFEAQQEPQLLDRVVAMSQTVFGMPPSMGATLKTIVREAPGKVFGVLATAPSGEDAASGLVMTTGDTGFFTGGAILPKFQGLGLWRQVSRRRQELSHDYGIRHWFYNTINGRIRGKGTASTQMITLFLL